MKNSFKSGAGSGDEVKNGCVYGTRNAPRDGFLILNKPSGMPSFKALSIVKKRLGLQKVGFLGTLDPNADGVLVLLIGKATKLANELHKSGRKIYVSRFQFGVETDTLDPLGKVIKTCDKIPTREEIEKVLPTLIGDIEIEVPKFSAVHVNGERAYDLARKGIEFEAPKKMITVYNFRILRGGDAGGDDPQAEEQFEVTCSSGTYIRSLAKLLAEKLGTLAIAKTITRVRVGEFDIKDAKDLQSVSVSDIISYVV